MITDEQVKEAVNAWANARALNKFSTNPEFSFDMEAMRKALEAYEANKPMPEPVGYIYKNRLEQMLGDGEDNVCNFYLIKDINARAIFHSDQDTYFALYATNQQACESMKFDVAMLKLEIDNLKNQIQFRFDENVELVFQNETLKNDLFMLRSEYKQLVDEKNKLVEKYEALKKAHGIGV